jgi:hypothetical protein
MNSEHPNTPDEIREAYIHYVLDRETRPKSIYRFCKHIGILEEDFYMEFNSLTEVEESIFTAFIENTMGAISKDENYEGYSPESKILSFYYTLFENFGLYRSYMIFRFGSRLYERGPSYKQLKNAISPTLGLYAQLYESVLHMVSPKVASQVTKEALFLQFSGILQFWLSDKSKGFESTDAFIEKSVKLSFDLTNNLPLESIFDYGKFLLKEVRGRI